MRPERKGSNDAVKASLKLFQKFMDQYVAEGMDRRAASVLALGAVHLASKRKKVS